MRAHADTYYGIQGRLLLINSFLAFGFVVGLLVLHYSFPVGYVRLINEDDWGEYGTALGFGLAGLLLLRLAAQQQPWRQRLIYGFIGVLALLIGLEEISWGQRILRIETPDALRALNVQGELTLHNLEAVDNIALQYIAGGAVLLWAAGSALALLAARRMRFDLAATGLPFLPWRIMPLCLPPAWLFLSRGVVKPDETGELALALLVLVWAVDLYQHTTGWPAVRFERLARSRPLALGAVALATAMLTFLFPGYDLGWRLNVVAARDYPAMGLNEQAREVFEHILDHPSYISDRTVSNLHRMFPELIDRLPPDRRAAAAPGP